MVDTMMTQSFSIKGINIERKKIITSFPLSIFMSEYERKNKKVEWTRSLNFNTSETGATSATFLLNEYIVTKINEYDLEEDSVNVAKLLDEVTLYFIVAFLVDEKTHRNYYLLFLPSKTDISNKILLLRTTKPDNNLKLDNLLDKFRQRVVRGEKNRDVFFNCAIKLLNSHGNDNGNDLSIQIKTLNTCTESTFETKINYRSLSVELPTTIHEKIILNDSKLNINHLFGVKSVSGKHHAKVKRIPINSKEIETKRRESNAKLISDYQVSKLSNVFLNPITFEEIAAALTHVMKEMSDSGLTDSDSNCVIELISSIFFEDVGWYNNGPKELNITKGYQKSLQVDLDQTVLEVSSAVFKDTVITDLQSLYNLLLESCPTNDNHDVVICKRSFFANLEQKPGHTYMSAKKRKGFLHVNSNFSTDVFKISIKVCNDDDRDLKTELWDNVVLVACWWELEKIGHSITGTDVNKLNNDIEKGYKHKIYAGALFPLLVILYVVSKGKEGETINFVLETYGDKARHTFPIDSSIKLKEVANKMLENSATFVIDRFAKLCSNIMTYSDIKLIFGVGACCSVKEIKKDKFAYAVINTVEPSFMSSIHSAANFFSTMETDLTDTSGDENNHIKFADQEDYENEIKQIKDTDKLKVLAHARKAFVPLFTRHKHFQTYPIFGGIIPIRMQPTTIDIKPNRDITYLNDVKNDSTIRIMQYSWLARNASGEKNVIEKQSDIMDKLQLSIYKPSETVPAFLSFQHLNDKINSFNKHLQENLKHLRTHGNIARIEVAFQTSDVQDSSSFLRKCILSVINSCINTKAYDADLVATIIDFLAKGHFVRVKLLDELHKTNNSFDSYLDMPDILQHLSSSLHKFYSGRYLFTDYRAYLPKCSYLSDRPISPKLTPLLNSVRKSCLNKRNKPWLEIFYDFLKYQPFQLPDMFPVNHIKNMQPYVYSNAYLCDKCWKIFSTQNQINSFLDHNCHDLMKGNKIDFKDPKYLNHKIETVYNLSNDQKSIYMAITDPLNKNNFFLTGVAGAGKSKTVCALLEFFLEKDGCDGIICLANTKNASIIINGITIHSFLGLNKENLKDLKASEVKQDLFDKHPEKALKMLQIKTLILDECSLLSANDLEFLDKFFKALFNCDLPFGNILIILVGDMLQLPPFGKGSNDVKFIFQSKAFCNSNFKVCYLKSSFRQKDGLFVAILNRMRDGAVTDDDLNIINNEFGLNIDINYYILAFEELINLVTSSYSTGTDYEKKKFQSKTEEWYHPKVRNCCLSAQLQTPYQPFLDHINTVKNRCKPDKGIPFVFNIENIESNIINIEFAKRAETEIHTLAFLSKDTAQYGSGSVFRFSDVLKQQLLVDTHLESCVKLGVGMKVQFTSNSIGAFVANNGFGTIVSMDTTAMSIIVKPDVNEGYIAQELIIRQVTKSTTFKHNGSEVTASRSQFPLRVANASSVHGALGQTFHSGNYVICNNLRVTKTSYGVLYTAFSRVQSSDDIIPLYPVTKEDFLCNPIALQFDLYHRNKASVISPVDYYYDSNKRILGTHPFELKNTNTHAYVPTNSHKEFVERNMDPMTIKATENIDNLDYYEIKKRRSVGILEEARNSSFITPYKKKQKVTYKQMALTNQQHFLSLTKNNISTKATVTTNKSYNNISNSNNSENKYKIKDGFIFLPGFRF